MQHIFQVPQNRNYDVFDQSRLNLTYRVNLVVILALAFLIALSVFSQSIYVIIYSLAFVANIFALIYLRVKKRYKPVALLLSAFLYALILYSYFRIDGYIHFLEPFWSLVIVVYLYFILGKIAGGIALLITIIASSFYFLFRIQYSIDLVDDIELVRVISMTVEFAICLLLIGYILHQFINTNTQARKIQEELNNELRREKSLVDRQNSEKTILLQEIHHRVKNNLQIITSLLRMQAEEVNSPETRVHFQEAINRVMTMSLVHQKLYENDNLSDIDLQEYLETLTGDIISAWDSTNDVERKLEVQCTKIGAQTLMPIGLIITELVTNSLKHAFNNARKSKIAIRIEESAADSSLKLVYMDNGNWIEPTSASFGMSLIETFTEQLDGKMLRTSSDEGSTFTFVLNQIEKE